MGSMRHPRLLSRAEVESLRTVFHEIYDPIQGQNVFRPIADDDELKAQIIERLLEVIEDGTPPTELKSKVLRSLPFR